MTYLYVTSTHLLQNVAKMMQGEKSHLYSICINQIPPTFSFTLFRLTVSAISFHHFALSVGCQHKHYPVNRILCNFLVLKIQYLKGGSGHLYFQELIICRLGTSRYMQNGAYTQIPV